MKRAKTDKKPKADKRRKRGDGSIMVRNGVLYLRYSRQVRADDGNMVHRPVWESTGIKLTGDKDADADAWKRADAILKARTASGVIDDEITRRRKLLAEIAELETEKSEADRRTPGVRIDQAFDTWKKSPRRKQGTSATTLDQYRSEIDRFKTWIATAHPRAVEMKDVTPQIADQFVATEISSLSSNRYNKYIDTLRRIWRDLAREAHIVANPWSDIRHKPKDEKSRRVIRADEMPDILAAAGDDLKPLFIFGWYTGMRLGDAVNANWSGGPAKMVIDIDGLKPIISYIPQKTKRHADGKRTMIGVHPDLLAVLSAVPAESRRGYLFPKLADHYKRNAPQFSRRVQAVFTKAKIKTRDASWKKAHRGERARIDVGFHSFRHSYVSNQLNQGTALSLVQAQVGHSNPEMTSHYYHADADAIANAAAVIPSILAGPEGHRALAEPTAIDTARAAIDKLSADEIKTIIDYIKTKRTATATRV